MANINIKLTDGKILKYKQEKHSYTGCPTCNFGSEYINELKFTAEVEWSENVQVIEIVSNQMYEYAEELNEENIIKLLTEIIEEPVGFHDFVRICMERLNIKNNEDMEMEVYEKVKFI